MTVSVLSKVVVSPVTTVTVGEYLKVLQASCDCAIVRLCGYGYGTSGFRVQASDFRLQASVLCVSNDEQQQRTKL